MLVSLKEISKYVDISDLTPEKIAKRLTEAGIEVEEIKTLANATNLVIGEVIECEKIKESDHLHICKVNIGDDILSIVCGAPNVRVGLKVIVAKVGAILNNTVHIIESTICKEKSEGMLCSLKELGVDEKYLKKEQIEGIEELGDDAKVGDTEVLKYLGLDDTILDLKLLANRSDCLSLFNVSKEISALFKKELNLPTFKDNSTFTSTMKVSSDSNNSKAFRCREFKDVHIKESPKWLKEVLRSEGIRSINNIVDIGNYVMLLTGQPVHMYDLDKLPKHELIVKDDLECDVKALDEKIYHIEKGDLVVTSNNEPVCIAGVMGLEKVAVTESSKNICLEVASFYGPRIRKTSSRLGLSSDSSMRYVKGIDPNIGDLTLLIASNLVSELAETKEISKTNTYDKVDHSLKVIKASVSYINNRLASFLSKKEILDTLKALKFNIISENDDEFEVEVPSYRIDVEGKADLSEEIVRYLGFDIVKDSLPLMETTLGGRYLEEEKVNKIKEYLLNNGLYEILTYTLINEKDYKYFHILNDDEPYILMNPLTEDHKIVRTNLLSSLLRCVEYNLNHQNKNFSLFEVSNIETKKVNEEHLSLALVNLKEGQELFNAHKQSFFDLKGYIYEIFNLLNISESRIKLERFKTTEFHPYRSALVYLDNKVVGVFGELHPNLKQVFGIKKDEVIVGELNLTKIINTRSANNKFKDFSKFPSVSRDYAFYVSDNDEYSKIIKEIKKCSSLIKDIKLFDIYKDKETSETSIALSVTLEKFDKSFTNEEITLLDEKIKDIIVNKLKLKVRS